MWRRLSRAERVEILAYEYRRDEQRAGVLRDVIENIGGELAVLAQIIMSAMD